MNQGPIPADEAERIKKLINLDLDYNNLEEDFKEIVLLVSRIMGTKVSLINLLDSYTQWTIAGYGVELGSMPRNESVCQYTLLEDSHLEINNLAQHTTFRDKAYVAGDPHFRYYLGVPLRTLSGVNIGSLCVLDNKEMIMEPEKIELLKIIAEEVMNKLEAHKMIKDLKEAQYDSIISQKKRAREVQDLLAGIIGVTELLLEDGPVQNPEDLHEYIKLMNTNSNAIFAISREALISQEIEEAENIISLPSLAEKLETLLQTLSDFRKVKLSVVYNPDKAGVLFSKLSIMQLLNIPISAIIMNARPVTEVKISLDILVEIDHFRISADVTADKVPASDSKAFALAKKHVEANSGTLTCLSGDCGEGYNIVLPIRVAE